MPIGNIVEEFQIGDTKFIICDDFCREKTTADAEEILRKIAEEIYPVLRIQSEKTG